MKQVGQSPRTGEVRVAEVPVPVPGDGEVLVALAASLISGGTERYVTDFARKSLLAKAIARQDLVRQVIDKVQRDGPMAALQAVQSRLDRPSAPGYGAAGTVVAVGSGVTDLRAGERVACAGAGYAVHAEAVSVPRNLVVRVPDGVDLESASFAALGAVAQHGIRLSGVRFGEVAAVIGLGLVGQLTVQLLKLAGCAVAGMEPDPARAELAGRLGADATATDTQGFAAAVRRLSSDRGADVVLITAAADDDGPVELAGEVARDRGVVVAVGTVGTRVPRPVYYEKELDFRISRSYGPGRYDTAYEEKGHDYPIGYVRWTENRNMEAFVQFLAEGHVSAEPLVTHRFPIERAGEAYDLVSGKAAEPHLGVLLRYPGSVALETKIALREVTGRESRPHRGQAVGLGLIGAGSFANSTLLPVLRRTPGVELVGVCTARGLGARHAGEKFGFRYCATSEAEILADREVDTVAIATRHHLHARQVAAALAAGKHVFCEKPLCLSEAELAEIIRVREAVGGEAAAPLLLVGYNRRFSPMARELRTLVEEMREPAMITCRVNAGHVPANEWIQDPAQGGRRIVGEACHFVDLLSFLAGSTPRRVWARALQNGGRYCDDNVTITLELENGFLGTIVYVANGTRSFSKERIEVFGGGMAAALDDFRRLELVRGSRREVRRSRLRQDKGHRGEWEAFVEAVRSGGTPPIAFSDLVATSLATFRIVESLQCGEALAVDLPGFLAAMPSR